MSPYDHSKNWITALPGSITTQTDLNGRMTYDGVHTYAWDVEGKMISVDSTTCGTNGTCMTYDALGRMVEKNVSAAYTQIVYSPIGRFALMNGQSLVKAFVPLPTGATAVYTSSGLAYYRHSDHLGSSRLASTPSRTLYSSTAYAPFGEPYNQAGTTDLSFTGQDQDTVSGMHDFPMRKFVPVQGRWLSPDPSGLASANPASPQSFNRYVYVMNTPLNATDPLGLNIDYKNCVSDARQNPACQGGGGGCNPDAYNCMGGAGTGDSGSGGGGFCDASGDCSGIYDPYANNGNGGYVGSGSAGGVDANGVPNNFSPGYNMRSSSGAAMLLSQQKGWYKNCVDFSFNCDQNGKPLAGPGETIWINCEGTQASDGSVTLGQCAAPLQISGQMTPDLQSIYHLYSNTLFQMIHNGNRRAGSGRTNAFINNAESWFNNYYSCNQQAGALTTCLNGAGPEGWTYIFQGVNPVGGVFSHYITVAVPANPSKPTIFMDPWLNQIWAVH